MEDFSTLFNLLLAGKFDTDINTIILGGRLLAMAKKDGGVRPIAVSYTLRRLTAKCANRHVIEGRSKVLQPKQVGVGVAGEAKAAVNAMRRYVEVLPAGHAVVKLDFSNAFNSIRRDLQLDTIAKNILELYRFTLAKYSYESTVVYGEHTIPSREGSQQGIL